MLKYLFLLLLVPSFCWAQFDPTTVGTGSSVILEFNTAHSGSCLEADTSSCEDADLVATWSDQSGNADDAVQTDSAKQLTYDIDGFAATYPCMQGASGDSMTIADRSILRNSSGWTLAWLVDYVDSGTYQGVLGTFNPDFNIRWSHTIDSSDQPYAQLRNPDATNNFWTSAYGLTNGNEHVVIWRQDLAGSEGSLWVDGTEQYTVGLTGTSNTTDSDSPTDIAVFDDALNEAKYNMSCTAAIIVWGEALSDADIGTASTGLANNFSTPTPTPTPSAVRTLTTLGAGK